MTTERCPMSARVDLHFERRLAPEEERVLRAHLPECARCRARYESQLLLERLDPTAAGPEARMASGLGIGRPRPIARIGPPLAAALALAASVAFLVTRPGPSPDTGFTARGGGDEAGESSEAGDASYVVVYRGAADAGPTRAGTTIGRHDELTFGYGNAAGKKYLLVFGVDEHRHVFWYYPAWSDPKDDPRSIAIEPGARSLPDAIRHDLDGAQLDLHAVFSDTPLTVKTVEATIANAPPGTRPAFGPGAIDRVIRFEVLP